MDDKHDACDEIEEDITETGTAETGSNKEIPENGSNTGQKEDADESRGTQTVPDAGSNPDAAGKAAPQKKPITARGVIGRIISVLTIILSPPAAVWLVQNFTLYHLPTGTEETLMWKLTNHIYPTMFWVNIGLVALVYLLLAFLFGSFRVGYLIADVLFMAIGCANYFVVQFRGSPIVPWDLLSLKTAASVAGNYTYSFNELFIASIIGFAILIVSAAFTRARIRRWPVRLLGAALMAGLLLFGVHQLQDSDVKESLGMDTTLFTPIVRYRNNGFLAAFLANLNLIQVEKPDGYSVSAVEEIAAEVEEDHASELLGTTEDGASAVSNTSDGDDTADDPDASGIESATEAVTEADDTDTRSASATAAASDTDTLPNIYVIVDEAFADLQVLGEFETDQDYMPNFRRIMEESAGSGYLMVSIKGGNTSNSEYEFLTGDTMAFLPSGSVVYQQLIRDDIPALPWYLKDFGYSTTAIHPYQASGWNRDTVMPQLGFDTFLSQKDFDDPIMLRNFISDQSAFDKIIELYEEKDEDEKQFVFEITMQNHSGYSQEYEGFTELVHLTELGYSNTQTRAAEKYLTLVYYSDEAAGNLVDYFSQVDEPTIIIMFGDHEPSDYVTNVITNLTGYDPEVSLEEAQKSYLVPYFVWANYDLEMENRELTSLNYLAADVLEAVGLPLTDYQEFLLDLQDELPVICANAYVDAGGNYYSYDDSSAYDEDLLDYSILQYNHLYDISNRVTEVFSEPKFSSQ